MHFVMLGSLRFSNIIKWYGAIDLRGSQSPLLNSGVFHLLVDYDRWPPSYQR